MSFKEFDMQPIEEAKKQYEAETAARWGNSDAFQESKQKTDRYGKEEWGIIMGESEAIFRKFASNRGNKASSAVVQSLVEEWKAHISKHYHLCTNEILAGLGQMYVCDERFTANIDKFGEGTARLMNEAISIYCQ